MTDTSFYGNLSVSGNGTVSNTNQSGALGLVGEYGTPGFDVGGSPLAYYTDLLTVSGPGPVSIKFTEVFADTLSSSGGGQVSLIDELEVAGQFKAPWDTILNGPGTVTNIMTFNPGEQVTIRGGLLGGGTGSAPNYSPPKVVQSFSYSGSGPLYIDVLTAGGGYTAQSGTLYPTTSPVTSPVPEPVTYVMLLSGLGLLGFMARHRQSEQV